MDDPIFLDQGAPEPARKDAESEPLEANMSLLNNVHAFWRDFDLDGKRPNLDQSGLEMAKRQQQSASARKALAAQTKSFKKASGSEKFQMVGPLLKAYQGEIDRLTKRSRYAETTFLSLYKSLYEAPDPAPALGIAVEDRPKIAALQFENKKHLAELSEYEGEFAALKNQDITIRQLEDKLEEYEEQMEKLVEERVEGLRQQLQQSEVARSDTWREQKDELEAALRSARQAEGRAQSQADDTQTQLFELRNQLDEQQSSLGMELETVAEQLAQSNATIDALQRECTAVKEQLRLASGAPPSLPIAPPSSSSDPSSPAADAASTAATASGTAPSALSASLQQQLEASEATVMTLHSDLTRCRSERAAAAAEHSAELQRLNSRAESHVQQIEALQREVEARPTAQAHSRVRRQLQLLQEVQFNVEGEQGGEQGSGAASPSSPYSLSLHPAAENGNGNGEEEEEEGGGAGGATAEQGVEAILRRRLRAVERECASLRARTNAAQAAAEESRQRAEKLEAQLDHSQSLVAQLETHVAASTNTLADAAAAAAAAAATATGGEGEGGGEGSAADGDAAAAETPALRMVGLGDATAEAAATAIAAPDTPSPRAAADVSVLSILRDQRDRFRDRTREMEAAKQMAEAVVQQQKERLQRLNQDNIQLYEKIKYLQSYRASSHDGTGAMDRRGRGGNGGNGGGGGGGGGGVSHNPNQLNEIQLDLEANGRRGGGGGGGGGSVEREYAAQYERGISPFTVFHRRQRQSRYSRLSATDKITLSGGKFFLSSSLMRRFLFFYALALHTLVFITLYHFTHFNHHAAACRTVATGHRTPGNH